MHKLHNLVQPQQAPTKLSKGHLNTHEIVSVPTAEQTAVHPDSCIHVIGSDSDHVRQLSELVVPAGSLGPQSIRNASFQLAILYCGARIIDQNSRDSKCDTKTNNHSTVDSVVSETIYLMGWEAVRRITI